jgi:hypothetical protein
MNARTPAALAATILSLLALGACASGDGGSASGGQAPAPAMAGKPQDGIAAPQRNEAASFDSASGFSVRGPATTSSAKSATSVAHAPDVQAQSIISTGTVSLQSSDLGGARFDLMRIVDEHRGEVSDEQTSTDDSGRISRSRLVVRVPSGDFSQVMDELGKVPGTDLKSAKRSSEDVTTQVIDTAVRVRAQKASIDRIEALLARAKNLRSIIWIEDQLSRRQADLDSLEQQQAYLADQTSLSTITVYLERPPAKATPQPHKHDETGFAAGLSAGWHALTAAGTSVATALGALLPFAVLLLLLGLPAWVLLMRRRRAPVAATAD